MFLSAVPIVKAVMVGLAFASVATWTVWLAKTIELWIARRLARQGLEVLARATSLRGAGARRSLEAVFEVGVSRVPVSHKPCSMRQSRTGRFGPFGTTTVSRAASGTRHTDLKGIVHAPYTEPAMKPESRDALLAAITKARGWIDDIRVGAIGSFAEIAEREAQGERHIRVLAPLAFLSPRIIAAIVDGTAPADLTVTGLAKALPYSWAEQEERVGFSL